MKRFVPSDFRVWGLLFCCAWGLSEAGCGQDTTSTGTNEAVVLPDMAEPRLNHFLVPSASLQTSDISPTLPRGWEQLITYSNGSVAWQPSADCSALGASKCRPQILLPAPDGQYSEVYSTVADVYPGDIVRVSGQAEFTEQGYVANTIDVFLSVTDGGISRPISAYAAQVATRQDNHHMPIPLSGVYSVPVSGGQRKVTFSLLARKRDTSGVLIESTQCSKCGYLQTEVYRQGAAGTGLFLQELLAQVTTNASGMTPVPTTGNSTALTFPSLRTGDVLSVQTSVVNRFLTGSPDLISNVLYIPGSGGIVSNSSENISAQLPMSSLLNRMLRSASIDTSNYPVTLKVSSRSGSSFWLSDVALAGFHFGQNGKLLVRSAATPGSDFEWSDTQEKVILESAIDTIPGDIIRAESNVTLEQPTTVTSASTCLVSVRLLDTTGSVLHSGIRNGRILSQLYPIAHYLPFDAFTVSTGPSRVRVQTVAQCDVSQPRHFSAAQAAQIVEVFR